MKVCLDSSAYIAMRRGNRDVTAFLADCEVVIVPAAVVAELTEGFISDNKGRPIPQNDIWIAATAFETGSRVLSYDHHFDEIDGLGRLAP